MPTPGHPWDLLERLARQNLGVPRELRPIDVPDDVVRATRVYGSPIRLAILRALRERPLQQQAAIRAVGIGYSTFRAAIAELVDAGAVRVIDAENRSPGRPVTYALDEQEVRRLGVALLAWAVGDPQ